MNEFIKKLPYFFILIALFAVVLAACDKGPPIPEEKFLNIYVDLLIIQDTTTSKNFSIDSVRAVVLAQHNVSQNQYDEMISYYNSTPEKWIAFFDTATAYVEELKKDAEKQP